MLAYTTDDLNTIFRSDVDDDPATRSPTLWSDNDVYRYMTSAADAVARDVEGIYRVLSLAVVAGVQAIRLPRNVLHIREARLVTQLATLKPSNANDALHTVSDDYGQMLNGSFWTATGRPQFYVRDYQKQALLLTPIPSINDTLELQCTTTLATPLVAGLPMPFMDVPDQELMLLYMQYRAYRKQDADTLDLKRSDALKKQYDDEALLRKEKLESYRRTPAAVTVDW